MSGNEEYSNCDAAHYNIIIYGKLDKNRKKVKRRKTKNFLMFNDQ